MSGKKILVVDDDPSVRFLLRLIFESAGYEVTEAQHGVAALIRIKNAFPDLVVTDMMMPVMDGGRLIKQLRSDAGTAGIRILAMTANPTAREVARGADAVLGKPFRNSALLATVNSLLAKKSVNAGQIAHGFGAGEK